MLRRKGKLKYLFSTSQQQVISSYYLESRASVDAAISSECKHLNNKHVPSPSFSYLLMLSMASYEIEYPFGHFRSAILAVSSLKLFPTPSLLAFGAGVGDGWRDSPDAVQALLRSRQSISV